MVSLVSAMAHCRLQRDIIIHRRRTDPRRRLPLIIDLLHEETMVTAIIARLVTQVDEAVVVALAAAPRITRVSKSERVLLDPPIAVAVVVTSRIVMSEKLEMLARLPNPK